MSNPNGEKKNEGHESTWGATPKKKTEWAESHQDEEKKTETKPPVREDRTGRHPAGDANRPATTTQNESK
jgi:hypothetical protein